MRPEVREWAQRQLAAFPPLTPAQRDMLAALLSESSVGVFGAELDGGDADVIAA